MKSFLIENHDEAYHLWRRAGFENRSLVHVDAHHDMWWLDDAGSLTIANYVCQAIKEGIVNEVAWVVPTASWATPSSRRVLRQHLSRLAGEYGTGRAAVKAGRRRLSARLGKTLVTVCALDTIPSLAGPVLLDIDADFMTLPVVSIGQDGRPGDRPWIWPDAVAEALRKYGWVPEFVTIAYSVEGGYTPIAWKWLADALAAELQPGDVSDSQRAGYAALRTALGQNASSAASVIGDLTVAARHLPRLAAPQFNLALRHLGNGSIEEARRFFDRAAERDPACRGPFGSRGFSCLKDGHDGEAAREFERLGALDPGNAFVELGMARIAIGKRRWRAAEAHLKRSLHASPRLVDAHRHLGDVLIRLGRSEDAAPAYARALKLALEGERSLEELASTNTASRAVRHGHHGYLHAALARIDAKAGRIPAAIAGLRMAMAAGDGRASVSGALARLLEKTARAKQKKAAPAKR